MKKKQENPLLLFLSVSYPSPTSFLLLSSEKLESDAFSSLNLSRDLFPSFHFSFFSEIGIPEIVCTPPLAIIFTSGRSFRMRSVFATLHGLIFGASFEARSGEESKDTKN